MIRVMTSTPLWVPLAVAGLGFLGTIIGTVTGVFITQRRSDRREDARWERERDHERELWKREDSARTFDHRREVYTNFYERLKSDARAVYYAGMGLGPALDEFDWQIPLYDLVLKLEVFATAETAELAKSAYNALWQWGVKTKHGVDDEGFYDRQAVYDERESEFLEVLRRDLAIEDATPMIEGP